MHLQKIPIYFEFADAYIMFNILSGEGKIILFSEIISLLTPILQLFATS